MNSREILSALMCHLEQGDREAAFSLMVDITKTGMSREDFYDTILLPALGEIGARWEADRMTITEEHIATEILRQYVAASAPRGKRPADPRGTVMIGCVPSEYHDIPAMIAAHLVEQAGWRVLYFGQSVPADDLVRTVGKIRPDALCLTIKLIARIDEAAALLVDLRDRSPGTKIILGGIRDRAVRNALSGLSDGFVESPSDAVHTIEALVHRISL